MGAEIAALMGLFGLGSAFALVGLVLAAWMAWRIVEKAGLPGWTGLGAILLTVTGVGSIVPLILLWVFAFIRWPRDEPVVAAAPGSAPSATGQLVSGGGDAMRSLAVLMAKVIDIYPWIVIAGAIISWLVAFGVTNVNTQFMRVVVDLLYRLTEPVLRPIRKILPNLGGVDISPIVVLLLIFFLRHLIVEYMFGR